MAANSPEYNRRYQKALRAVLRRFQEEEPERYKRYLSEALNSQEGNPVVC